MALGILLRFVAEPLAASGDRTWVAVGVASAVLQLVAVVLFVANTAVTRYRPKDQDSPNVVVLYDQERGRDRQRNKPLTWPTAFVLFSLVCFVVAAAAEPFVFAMSHQPSPTASIQFVAEWFPIVREVQFLGFVSSMIFGIALSKFHECLGLTKADRSLGVAGFAFWVSGLSLRALGWLAYFRSGLEPGKGLAYHLGAVLLLAGAVMIVGSSGVFGRTLERLRSHKFVRAAFGWLLVAGLMMAVEPIVLSVLGRPFSHAFTGAVRHALTVGFISQMIVGFSSRVVPNLLGIPESALPRLWPTFWLLNVGNAFRVGCEVATDFSPAAFAPMGATGFVELVGLAIWAAHILSLLTKRAFRVRSYGML
jgi:hypothetical protein